MSHKNEPENPVAFFVGLKNAMFIMIVVMFVLWAAMRLWNLL